MMLENPDEYADITPVPSPQDPSGPFGIDYSEGYNTIMSLYRALLDRVEFSPRALTIVTRINTNTPSNATAWWYRQRIIESLGYNLDEEFSLLQTICEKSPKPYQIWCHRMWLVLRCEEPPDETAFAQFVINRDEKNFHAWSYFGWYADRFDKWEWLYHMTTKYVQHDLQNNSAWSARYRALQRGGFSIADDLEFTLNYFKISSRSESICNYLRGILELDFSHAGKVKEVIEWLVAAKAENRSLYALAAHIAKAEGNFPEHDAYVDKIIALDAPRARFWQLMKSDSKGFE
jgi:protein farnesyltransferase/geranylgeranyltransferase type-1 subunit alpha